MKKGLEWQVSSLESSIELMDLGVRQDSHLVWAYGEGWKPELLELHRVLPTAPFNIVCAFTVAELGEMLPRGFWFITACDDRYFISPKNVEEGKISDIFCNGVTEAEARAKMLIYLIKNKLIKVSR